MDTHDLKIPSLPATTALLIEMCRDVECSYKQLARVIESDPGLAVRIMTVVNSARYAQRYKISSMLRAVTVLGLDEVRNIGFSYQLKDVMNQCDIPGFNFETYWENSLLLGVLAREIARQIGKDDVDDAFFVGLLQEVGILILRHNRQQDYQAVTQAARQDQHADLRQLEKSLLGIDHAEVGAAACTTWQLPDTVAHGVRHHHDDIIGSDRGVSFSQMHAVAYATSLMPDFILGIRALEILEDLDAKGILAPDDIQDVFGRAHGELLELAQCVDKHAARSREFVDMLPADQRVVTSLTCGLVDRLMHMAEEQRRVFEP